MRKKICFVLPEYARATHFQYVAEFVEGLAEHADVFLVIEKGELPEESKVTHRVRQIFQFPLLRFFEIGWILFCARLRGYRVQYVHYSFSAAFWSSIITRASGGTTYYWNAGLPWLYQRPRHREFFERLVYKLIGRLVTGADAIVEGYAEYYGISNNKIIVIPNWIDGEEVKRKTSEVDRATFRSKLNISLDAPIVLFVHRLAKRKGAHLLPEVLATLPSQTVLVVVGDGPERENIVREFERRGLSARVRMEGAVAQSSVIKYFAIADVFLLPSEEEGCPHVLLEALAAGVPYAAFAVGGVREMTPEKLLPYVAQAGDTKALIAATNDLIALSPSVREEVISEEREWVKQYRKEAILKRFFELVR
jgi:glycosyltransferase involved in cell wall biosynthesis